MKTAMQELLGLVEQMFNNAKTIEIESSMNDVINIITQEGLPKEKEQMCDFVEYCEIEHSKYQETEASWIKELTIDDLFEKRYTK
jgi:hypothetical protein